MVFEVANGWVGKRRLMKAATGKNKPVMAKTLKKKNNQRGHKVGKVELKRYAKPAKPIRTRIIAAGIVERTEGDDIVKCN